MYARIGLLVLSLLTLAFSLLFSATPIAWHLTGSQAETYPEFLFAFYHLPTAVFLVADSLMLVFLAPPPRQRARGTQILWCSALSKFGALILLSLAVCLPMTTGLDLGQLLLNVYHLLILLPLVAASVAGALSVFRSRRTLRQA